MQFLATSTRPSFGFGVAAMGSLPPESLATILFGNVFGSLRWTYDYWGPDWHTPVRGHLDRPGDELPVRRHDPGPASPLARDRRRAAASPASSASSSSSASSALLYALGRYTPGFEVIFDHSRASISIAARPMPPS